MCVSVCVCVFLYVSSGYKFSTAISRKFIFSIQIHGQHIYLKFDYQGDLVKVNVKSNFCHILTKLSISWVSILLIHD